ncbi:DUF3781 domain-containing protein [Clostridium sp. E02]|uniref:DUF3781 domain-containing protein n=1 Tax=Clostridium sp. E02 TaxID=2487134 RepID=UPI00325C3173
MIINPKEYVEMLEDKTYCNLLKVRDSLLKEIRKFEKYKDKDRIGDQRMSTPSPEATYHMNLQYLGKICEMIAEVYIPHCIEGNTKETTDCSVLLNNIEKLHSTESGIQRIRKNLKLDVDDAVDWCVKKIIRTDALISREGKNWYVIVEGCRITVNATSYTIITAHKENKKC